MAGIDATDEEKRQMAMKGYSEPRMLPGASGPPKITYHNPKTGQEFRNLPADSYNLMHYLSRGFAIGPASPELKTLWENREQEIVHDTVFGTDLPPELKASNMNNQSLIEEVSELKAMVKALVASQLGGNLTKSDIINTEEEITEEQVPYDTQLGMFEE